jgi:hypothetical protein
MSETLAKVQEAARADQDERSVQKRMAWFVEKWTTQMDLNKRDAGEFAGDLAVVVQAVHRDASRTTHEMLARAMSVMPAPNIILKDN